ncbi:hypothetical protein ACIRRA_39710 [Nocardia sp. NPDC101769]|uniref:hypothetical protein n=1 Tax=Nocardia sp. NPDC101769 TaxID=3364333 RepID=UPI00382C614B
MRQIMIRIALLASAATTALWLTTGTAQAMTAEVCEGFGGKPFPTTVFKLPDSAKAEAGEAYCVCRHDTDKAIDGMPVWGDWIWVGTVASGATPGFYHCAKPTG